MSNNSAGAALAALTGPGGPFEVVTTQCSTPPVRNFARRHPSVRELIDDAASRRANREFLVSAGRRITFGEFAELVWGTAHRFQDELRMQPGDRVAVLGPNTIDWLVTMFAATASGATGVALNAWWSPQEQAFAVADSGARFLFIDPAHSNAIPTILESHSRTVETVIALGERAVSGGDQVLSDLVAASDTVPSVPIAETDPFVLLYTSGTTGRPKGCITTHQGTIAQLRSTLLKGVLDRQTVDAPANRTRDRRQPTLLATTPFFHVSGLHAAICLSISIGSKVVIPTGRFDPAEVLRLIEAERVTAWGAVPTMVQRVVTHPDVDRHDLSSLESVAIGGAPLAPEILDRAHKVLGYKPSLGNGYGLTETHGPATMNSGAGLAQRPDSVGRPNPLIDIRVVDEAGRPCPPCVDGEIEISGVTVTPGYYNAPEATADAFHDGWFRTGDIGHLDEDGYLYIVDRAKDVIIRGGENVYSVEVENCLMEHPGVEEAAVIGVPDEVLGECVVAVVHPASGVRPTESGLRRHVSDRLARFKVPERFVISDEPMPRNAAGKVLKQDVRALVESWPA